MTRYCAALLTGWMGIACLCPQEAGAQLVVRNEDVAVKFGILGQFRGDWTQEPGAAQTGYQQNLYLRRVRLMVGGEIGHDISFFFETDNPKLGMTPKALGSGFMLQDAFVEWKADRRLILIGGLTLVPFSRNALQSPASYYTMDISAVSTVNNAATQSSGLRDAGFETKGFFVKDRLQYRLGAFGGQRDAHGRNSLRTAGYLQYDFFSPETAYTFAGTMLGKQKLLVIDAGFDRQGSYGAWSANIAGNFPVRGGDEIGGQFQFVHYNGRQKFPAIPEQDGALVETAYYIRAARVQPFVKYEAQAFAAAANRTHDIDRYGAGANYYIRGQNLKWTVQYLRAVPGNGTQRPCNELSTQLQLFYF